MLNIVWLLLIFIAIICGIINDRMAEVANAVTNYAKIGFEIALGLTGIMAFWLGLMKVAEESGLIRSIAKLIRPIMVRLFPEVPPEHPAMGAMILNIAANVLGLANAATPLGIKAMQHLEKLNLKQGVASNAMCMFLAINTSSVQLIPTTAIAYLASAGAAHPTSIITTALLATLCSTVVALVAAKVFERFGRAA